MKVAVVVAHLLDVALHRKPVGMNVGDRHENGDHQPAVMKILVFLHFLHHHYLAVSRRHHNVVRIAVKQADGAAEKVDHHRQQRARQHERGIPYGVCAQRHEEQTVEQHKRQAACRKGVRAFAVYSDSFESLDSRHGLKQVFSDHVQRAAVGPPDALCNMNNRQR